MRSPYNVSRTSLLVTPDTPRRRANRTKKVAASTKNTVAKAKLEPEPPWAESNGVTSEPDTGTSEYEHWISDEDADEGGCRAACSDGTETIAAFGDAVSEVFDLINEVAFPGVIDSAADAEEHVTYLGLNGESYHEDDDSIFVRSKAYEQNKKAKEFLDFIGATRPKSKQIVTTPAPSAQLLSPSGTTLNLATHTTVKPSEEVMIGDVLRKDNNQDDDDRNEVNETKAFDSNRQLETRIHDLDEDVEKKMSDEELALEAKTTDSLEEANGKNGDRYSIIVSSGDSDDSVEEQKSEKPEIQHQQRVTDVIYEKEKQKMMANSFQLRLGARQSLSSIARKKHGIIHRFMTSEQSELLTIAESSYEDESESDFEDVEEELREHKHQESRYEDVSSTGSESTYSSYEENCDRSFVDYSTASSADSYESTRHTRYSVEINETEFETDEEESEEESITCHQKSMEEDDYESATRQTTSTATNESSFEYEEEDYEEDYCDDSVSRHILPFESDEILEKHENCQSLDVQGVKSDDEDNGSFVEDEEHMANSVPETSTFCSIYDHLYPKDSIFSFGTHEEATENDTLPDFKEDHVIENDEAEYSSEEEEEYQDNKNDYDQDYLKKHENNCGKETDEISVTEIEEVDEEVDCHPERETPLPVISDAVYKTREREIEVLRNDFAAIDERDSNKEDRREDLQSRESCEANEENRDRGMEPRKRPVATEHKETAENEVKNEDVKLSRVSSAFSAAVYRKVDVQEIEGSNSSSSVGAKLIDLNTKKEMVNNKAHIPKLITKVVDRQTMKQRALARVKRFNRHKAAMTRQEKAE